MPQPNDLSRSLVALDQDSTIIAVVACRIAMKQPEISCFAARGAPIAAVLLGKQTLENEILRESLDA